MNSDIGLLVTQLSYAAAVQTAEV